MTVEKSKAAKRIAIAAHVLPVIIAKAYHNAMLIRLGSRGG